MTDMKDIRDDMSFSRLMQMTKQYNKIATVLLFVFLGAGVASLVAVFDYSFISPIHEVGHLLACLALGIKVVRVNWTGVEFVSVSDWRQNAVGFMGGLSAAFFLCLIYVLLDPLFSVLNMRAAHSLRLSRMVSDFSVLARAAVMTDIMVQITGGMLEGSSLPMYHQVFGSIAFAFVIAWGFSCFSLFWQSRKNLIMMIKC